MNRPKLKNLAVDLAPAIIALGVGAGLIAVAIKLDHDLQASYVKFLEDGNKILVEGLKDQETLLNEVLNK
jgi:hypothetical protein